MSDVISVDAKLRRDLDILLQDYWDAGVEHGREGQDAEAISVIRVATKQAICGTIDAMLGTATVSHSVPATAREVVVEQDLIDLERSIIECRTFQDFVAVQKTVLAARLAQSWEI